MGALECDRFRTPPEGINAYQMIFQILYEIDFSSFFTYCNEYIIPDI